MKNVFVNIIVTCPPLNNPSNGQLSYNASQDDGEYPLDTEVTASCESGYSMSGSRVRTCQSDEHWSGEAAACHLSIYNHIYNQFVCLSYKPKEYEIYLLVKWTILISKSVRYIINIFWNYQF